MLASKHKIDTKPKHLAITIFATTISAYFAGVIMGVFLSNKTLDWATIEWGANILGRTPLARRNTGLAVTLPVTGALEEANVRRIISA